MKLVIPGTLPSLNEMINKSKANKFHYVKLKDGAISTVSWAAKQMMMKGGSVPERANYHFTWYCPNKRRDKDNIMSGQKFVFDGLQESGFLKNDGWKQIGDVTHKFVIDKANPRVEIEITEIQEATA